MQVNLSYSDDFKKMGFFICCKTKGKSSAERPLMKMLLTESEESEEHSLLSFVYLYICSFKRMRSGGRAFTYIDL